MTATLVTDSDARWTKSYAAKIAVDLQGACNLGGVTRAMHEIFRAYILEGTKAANTSAPMRLAMHQAAWLATGQLLLADDEYNRAREECEKLSVEGSGRDGRSSE